MDKVSDYIFVTNAIPGDLCDSLIDECNKKQWKKHTWYDYGANQSGSEPEKELDVMNCTQDQQNKITPHLIKALEDYQIKYSTEEKKHTVLGYLNSRPYDLTSTSSALQ